MRLGEPKFASRGNAPSSDITGQLTARLHLRAASYDIELELVLRRWLAALLPAHAVTLLNPGPVLPGPMGNVPWASFFQTLSDGVILCELINKVLNQPDSRIKIETSGKRLARYRNVSAYLAASGKLGIPSFTMDALQEGRDPSAVQLNLHRLYLFETRRAKKLQAKRLSRESSQASRRSSRHSSQTSLNGSSQSLASAAGTTHPAALHARTPISAMAPTTQFSTENEYERLLREIDDILVVGNSDNVVVQSRDPSSTDLGLPSGPIEAASPEASPDGRPVVPPIVTKASKAKQTEPINGRQPTMSEATRRFLQQLDEQNLMTPKDDSSWDVPESEEKEMVNWVNSKLRDQVPSPVGVSHCLGDDDMKRGEERPTRISNVGKDFRTGVVLLELLEALGTNVGHYEREVTSLYDCASNVSLAIRGLSAATFCPNFRPLEIVKGNAAATMEVLKYVREKFDVSLPALHTFSYFYDRLLEHTHSWKTTNLAPMKPQRTPDVSQTVQLIRKLVLNQAKKSTPQLRILSTQTQLLAVNPPPEPSAPKAAAAKDEARTHVSASAIEISQAHATMRKHIVEELVSSEQKYCENIRLLLLDYAEPLQHAGGLKEEELVPLTGRIRDIWRAHLKLLADLEDELAQWNDTSSVADIFRHHLPHLSCYGTYMKAYSRMAVHLAYAQRFNPEIAAIVQQFNGKVASQNGLWLESYMLMPIQRLPRIVLMLRDMVKHTPPTWEEAEDLANIIERLEGLLKNINSEIPQQHTTALKEMQTIILSAEGSMDAMACLSPDSSLVATAQLEGYKITKGGKSSSGEDSNMHRVVVTTAGMLLTSQKMAAQRKKVLGLIKTGTIVPDSTRKMEIQWWSTWKDCTVSLLGNAITAVNPVPEIGVCKMSFEDASDAEVVFKAVKKLAL
ncbi:hypothetical protein DFJ74DRAFT_772774 [Hyaloraphidium curvatum]|nr:hypothetical protein DFJ74DRAFT_772774 [Hyaloraphidium curvatum]